MMTALGVAVAASVIMLGMSAWTWWSLRHDRRDAGRRNW